MKTYWWIIGVLLAPSTVAAQAPDGKALYEKNCRMCHGAQGVPSESMVKMMGKMPTFNAAFHKSHSEDSVVKVIDHGAGKMKGYKDKLSHEEMEAVAKYVREIAEKEKPKP